MNYIQRWLVTKKLKNNFYKMNKKELTQHQAQATDKLWDYVRRRSPYYKRLYPEPIQFNKIPPSNKSEIMEHFNEINTENLDRDALVDFRIEKERTGRMEYYAGGYSVGLSSGTSGNRLLTVLSKKERDLYSCLLWARSGIPAKVKNYRVLFALRTFNPTFTEIGAFGVKMVYVDYTHPVEALVELINAKHLNILAGPPSLLLMIAGKKDAIDHHIEAVVSYAEVLDENAKNTLENSFQAPVVQIYQGAEGFIASTCQAGNLHINEDVLLVETIKNKGDGPASVLITDLYRRTQPLIRYHLGDLLEIDSAPCSCGSVFRVIKRIHGREDDIFVLLNRDGQPRYFFPDYVRRAIIQSSKEVLEYQAIQHSHERIEVRMILENKKNRAQIETDILKNLNWRAKKIGVKIDRVEFSNLKPEVNPQSKKLVRVIRKFPWKY